MASPSSQTTQGETLGRLLFSFPPKKQLRKLCRETERSWETGRVTLTLENNIRHIWPSGSAWCYCWLVKHCHRMLCVFIDTSRCFPAEVKTFIQGRGWGVLGFLKMETGGPLHRVSIIILHWVRTGQPYLTSNPELLLLYSALSAWSGLPQNSSMPLHCIHMRGLPFQVCGEDVVKVIKIKPIKSNHLTSFSPDFIAHVSPPLFFGSFSVL